MLWQCERAFPSNDAAFPNDGWQLHVRPINRRASTRRLRRYQPSFTCRRKPEGHRRHYSWEPRGEKGLALTGRAVGCGNGLNGTVRGPDPFVVDPKFGGQPSSVRRPSKAVGWCLVSTSRARVDGGFCRLASTSPQARRTRVSAGRQPFSWERALLHPGRCSQGERRGQAHFSDLKFVSQRAPIGRNRSQTPPPC